MFSFSLMRKMDTWLGIPLLKISSHFRDHLIPEQSVTPKKILITKFIGMGSTLLSFPLMEELRSHGFEITFIGFKETSDVVDLFQKADHVIRLNTKRLIIDVIKIIFSQRGKFDAWIDLEPTANFSAWIGSFLRIPLRIGFKTGKLDREKVFNIYVDYRKEKHISEIYLESLFTLKLNPIDKKLKETKFKRTAEKRVLFSVNCGELSLLRLWPEEHWAELANLLLKNYRLNIFFTGLNQHKKRIDRIRDKINIKENTFSLAGKTDLQELKNEICQSDLVIGVDSGTMHLAAICDVPTLTLFGPETPAHFSPRGELNLNLYEKLSCSPCLTIESEKKSDCKDNQCLKRITPDKVYQYAKTLL